MPDEPLDFVFWSAPVRLRPFEEQVRAAAAGGFTSLAITAPTYARARASGLSPADMKSRAADHGVPLRHLDTLATWAPVQLAGNDADLQARSVATLDQGFGMCAELGLTRILATAAYRKDAVPLPQLVVGFGKLCERAAQLGIWVDLEPMPFTGCPDVAAAWAIVGGAAQANSGILLDSWHFFKAGQTLDALANIPGRCFCTMQLSDAPLAQDPDTLAEDTIKARRWPGQGELPLVDFARAVQEKGFLTAVGQEVFNPAADQLSAEAVGRRAAETTRTVLHAAGIPAA